MATPGGVSPNFSPGTFRISSTPSTPPTLTPKEQEYVGKLTALKLDSILDQGPGEKACKALGQEVFDHFKNLPGGSSVKGIAAMKNVCNALWFQGGDGRLRKQYVERAWDGVGDSYEQWIA